MTLLAFTACTSLRAIEDFSPSSLRAQVEVGDEVHVVARNGKVYDMTVTRVGDGVLEGDGGGKRYKIAFEAIQHIEVAETDLVDTAAGTLATIGTVLALIVTYALIRITDDLSDD